MKIEPTELSVLIGIAVILAVVVVGVFLEFFGKYKLSKQNIFRLLNIMPYFIFGIILVATLLLRLKKK